VRRLEALDADQVDAREKASETGLVESPALVFPEQRAELEADEADLLVELAAERLLVVFTLLPAAARRDPPVAVLVAVAKEKSAAAFVDHGGTHALPPGEPARAAGELAEPAEPLVPRHGGVRGRGRREDEETSLAERPLLETEVGPRTKCAAIRLLADEGEPLGTELARDVREPLGGAREVGAAQVTRAWSGAIGRVRDADSLLEQRKLFLRRVETRGQLCGVQ